MPLMQSQASWPLSASAFRWLGKGEIEQTGGKAIHYLESLSVLIPGFPYPVSSHAFF